MNAKSSPGGEATTRGAAPRFAPPSRAELDAPFEADASGSAQDHWAQVGAGITLWIDWQHWLPSSRPIDPYLVWADVTRFAGVDDPGPGASNDDGKLAFAVELNQRFLVPPSDPDDLNPASPVPADGDGIYSLALAEMQIPGLYLEPVSLSHPSARRLATRYVTARVLRESIPMLLLSGDVRRMQLGLPRMGSVQAQTPRIGVQSDAAIPRVVLGFIDDGCPFAHPAFCTAEGATRVHFLWDQDRRRPAADGWERPLRAGYGAELRQAAMTAAVRKALQQGDLNAAYAAVNYGPVRIDTELHGTMFKQGQATDLPAGTMRRKSHGAGVMFLAAGAMQGLDALHPLAWQRALSVPAAALPQPVKPLRPDYADKWPLIFVQLPTRTVLDTSGGSLAMHVMDGMRYIVDRAECIGEVDKAPVTLLPNGLTDLSKQADGSVAGVANPNLQRNATNNSVIINISFGATAGPHDGTSIVEQAMAELVAGDTGPHTSTAGGEAAMVPSVPVAEHKPGAEVRGRVWVCVAAGNAHRSRVHARLRLQVGLTKTLVWTVGPDNPHQSFLEVWLPDCDEQNLPLDAHRLERLAITLRGPDGMAPVHVKCGQAWVHAPRGERPLAGAVYARRVAQGLRGTMVLLAVAPTRAGTGFGLAAPHGRWHVDVSDGAVGDPDPTGRTLVVQAWVERNDLVYGNRRGQQSTVWGDDPIPEPTEHMPESQKYLGALPASSRPSAGRADQLMPTPTLGTLAGGATPWRDVKYSFHGHGTFGAVLSVGAHRAADGEVSPYSAGGPSRHQVAASAGQTLPDHSAFKAESPVAFSASRNRLDATAAADIGTALTGLRVAGMRAGEWERMSGTSAAAPLIARVLAQLQYHQALIATMPTLESLGLHDAEGRQRPNIARPTPTPKKDDLYRRGRKRLG